MICSRLNPVAKIVCFAQISKFLKPFEFSSNILWLFIIFLTQTSLKLTMSLSKNLNFCIISTSNLQEKGMGFLFLTTYFMFWALFSWICELLLWFVISIVLDMGWVHVCCVWVCGFGWSCFLNAKYGYYHVLVSLF